MARSISYTIPLAWDGQTVQNFLRREIGMSWRMVVKLKRVENGMMLDGVHVRTIDPLKAGQTLTVTMPDDAVRIEGVDLPLSVVFEDEDLLVVDKPPYLAVHPSGGKTDPTLANAVVAHYAANGETLSFRPINRLDRNTSGLLVAAKNAHAAFALTGKTHKEYLAVVRGKLTGEGTIREPIRIKEGCTITREVGEGGKDSITLWKSLATDGEISLVSVVILTGRTHQIRVHMAWLGYPLVGDTMYGTDDSFPRHALHCARITLPHPTANERTLDFHAPFPADMHTLLQKHGLQEAIPCLP